MSEVKNDEAVLREEEVLEIVKKDLGEGVGVGGVRYTVKPASDEPMGFLGEHYRVEAEVSTGDATRRTSYFLKRMPTEVPEHREYAVKTRAFYKEVELYKTLFVDLKNAQSDLEDTTKWCPEYFYSRGSELFVLEDLTSQGYYMYPERSYMDEEHIKASLRAMAAMHASSLVFEEKFNSGKVGTLSSKFVGAAAGKATLGEIYSHLTFETEASDVKGHPGNTYHEAGINSQIKIVEFLSGYSQVQKLIIQEKLPDVLRYSLQLVKPSNRFKNVFLHGDVWANNFLYRKDKTGKVQDALIIDFQLARYAPPAHDVMMFLHLVQSNKFRQDHQRRLLECYYATFDHQLRKNSLQADTLLPWQTFLDSCDFYNDFGLIAKLFYFQLILAPPQITAKFLSDPQLFTKTMLVDRTEMVLECFLKDASCRLRVTEAMNEVIDRFIAPHFPQTQGKGPQHESGFVLDSADGIPNRDPVLVRNAVSKRPGGSWLMEWKPFSTGQELGGDGGFWRWRGEEDVGTLDGFLEKALEEEYNL